jgi:hypothetical protein
VLVFLTTATYDERTKDEEKLTEDYAKSGAQEEVIWYKQTINNACGLYSILYAVSNGVAKDFIGKYKRSTQLNEIVGFKRVDNSSFISSFVYHHSLELTIWANNDCYRSSRVTLVWPYREVPAIRAPRLCRNS